MLFGTNNGRILDERRNLVKLLEEAVKRLEDGKTVYFALERGVGKEFYNILENKATGRNEEPTFFFSSEKDIITQLESTNEAMPYTIYRISKSSAEDVTGTVRRYYYQEEEGVSKR